MRNLDKISSRIEDCQLRLDLIKAGLFKVSKDKEMLLQGEILLLQRHKQHEEAIQREINSMLADIGCC